MQVSQVEVKGLKELEANFKILREEFGVKTGGIIIRGLRAGARIIRNDARKRVRDVPSGFAQVAIREKDRARFNRMSRKKRMNKLRTLEAMLRSNIVDRAIPTASARAAGRPTVLVQVRNHGYDRVMGKIRFNRPSNSPGWWWWLEFGTSRSPARPFLRPAFESQKVNAVNAARDRMKAEVEKLATKFKRTL